MKNTCILINISKISNNNKNIKNNKILFILILLISINICKPDNIQNNSTTCFQLFSNKTISQNCFNTTACCYLEYRFYDNNYFKCIEKISYDENMCHAIGDITSKENVTLSVCNCPGSFITIKFFIILFLTINIFY